jgi:hypothetical protein
LIEDAVQETAARVVAKEVRFTNADDLGRWAVVVAYRVAVDMIRKERRSTTLAAEPVATTDVPSEALNRYWLSAVRRAFPHLPHAEREALVDNAVHADRRAAVRTAVRRHRARAHLMEIAKSLGATVAWLLGRGSVRRPRRAAIVAALTPTLTFALLVQPGVPGESPRLETPQKLPVRMIAVGDAARASTVTSTSTAAHPRPWSSTRSGGDEDYLRVSLDPTRPGRDLGVRPKHSGDHFLCIQLEEGERVCIDLPIRLTE